MIENISKYYQSILNRLYSVADNDDGVFAKHALNDNLVTGFGHVYLYVNPHEFFGIVDDQNNRWFPLNYREIAHALRDRTRVQFSLQPYPGVSNFYRFGKTAKIVAIQILD